MTDQKKALLILLPFVFIGFIALLAFGAWVRKDLAVLGNGEDTSVVAYRACREFVEKGLKVPGSAKWPDDVPQDSEPLGEGRYRVRSYVIAKNALGVPVRTGFDCTVRRDGNDWTLETLDSK